jgi:SAM-dependent methyltransferase
VKNSKVWFEEWFDSPYYHVLYGHRDDTEAESFIRHLIDELQPAPDAQLLDLACGKGRHALQMAMRGYNVTGIDLSTNSIEAAKKLNHANLEFHVGDMRRVYFPERFDYVFNLFTSFGYFDSIDGHSEALEAIYKQLKPGGILVLDYLNATRVEQEVLASSSTTLTLENIDFHTRKRITERFISKEIRFTDKGQDFLFYEHVWRLNLADFENLLEKSGFKIQTIYGDYELKSFTPASSDRLILIAEK